MSKELEVRAVKNITDELGIITKYIKKLPYEAQYLFYSLFTSNRFNIFRENSWDPLMYFEALIYIINKYAEKGLSKSNLVTRVLTNILSRLELVKYGSQTSLKTIIEESFELKYNIIK